MNPQNVKAFLAQWCDVSSEPLGLDFNTEEESELFDIPGLIETRQYRSIRHPMRYFTSYWLASFEALIKPAHWHDRIKGKSKATYQTQYELGGTYGNTLTPRMAILRLRATSPKLESYLDSLLHEMVIRSEIVGARWGSTYRLDDFTSVNKEAAQPSSSTADVNYVLMLEHIDQSALERGVEIFLDEARESVSLIDEPNSFELLSHVHMQGLAEKTTAPQPVEVDLGQQNFN